LPRRRPPSFGPPPAPDPFLDGFVWTVDPTWTFGAVNDAPQPMPGSRALLNEIDAGVAGGLDNLELYNPTTVPIPVLDWVLMNGDASMSLSGTVPGHGFLVVITPEGFDLEEVELLYLFDATGVRVDQLGFHGAPTPLPGECLARCPDGCPPYLGYDYGSSGGGTTFRPLPCSLGGPNCDPSSAPGDGEIRLRWGRIKEVFR
jgi:hypothetical protein